MADSHDRDFLDSAVLSRLSRLAVHARIPMVGGVSGIHKSATRGASVEFAEYRKYVPGDDIKHVDWRVYGRSDRFYMKEFEAETNLRCYLIIDCSASMAFASNGMSKFEFARKIAGTIAYLLMMQGDAVGVASFAEKVVKDIPPRRTPSHLGNIFDLLSHAEPKGSTEIVQTIHSMAERIGSRALVIVISDFFSEVEPLMDCFQHMRFKKHDLAVFHLLDRQELDFGFDRPIRFMDMESSLSMITEPSVVRSGYQEALHKYLRNIKRGCEEFGVDYQRVITDTDYEQVLAAFLLQRMKKK